MKKVFTATLLGFLLVGCAPTKVDKLQQDYVCKDRGGVSEGKSGLYYQIDAGNASNRVQCMDGSYQEWKKVIIPKEYLDEHS